MSSRWSRQRREKRRYEEYLHDNVTSSTFTSGVSSGFAVGNNTNTYQETENNEGANANIVGTLRYDEPYEVLSMYGSTSDSSDSDDESSSASDIHVPVRASKNESAQNLLQEWAIKNQIRHSALKELLSILNCHFDSQLPLDPRTLCKTPSHSSDKIRKISGGEYFHFGLLNAINEFLESLTDDQRNEITSILLKVNCDGIPLSLSRAQGNSFGQY